jgi:urease gamma subunit
MTTSQVTNFNFLLDSLNRSTPQQRDVSSPDTVVLQALRDGVMPLADLVAKTNLSRDDIVEAVNRLLERRQIELLDQDGAKFIRLAKRAETSS